MSILKELNTLFSQVDIPIETGYFSGKPPDEYMVIIPMVDTFEVFADNLPQAETQEVRLSLFCKNNYISRKNQLSKILLEAGFMITDRRYIGFENDTKYHHIAIDCGKSYFVASEYELKEE